MITVSLGELGFPIVKLPYEVAIANGRQIDEAILEIPLKLSLR